MSKSTTKKLVPKLRFPNFRNAREWEETTLGKTVKFLDGKRKPIKESERATMQGQFPYYGASGIIDYVNNFIFDEDLILLGEDGENIVSRNLPLVFKVSGKCWVNNHAHVLQPIKLHCLEFLVQYMESLSYLKYNSGGAQPKLNQAVCKTIPLILPLPKEQQKIANCLSSIDDLITVHSQKHEALKAHKKGLMQQLFPAKGETVPKLRFPEFRDAGEWEKKKLGDLSKILRGGSPRPIDDYITRESSGLNWLKIADVNKDAKYVTCTKERVRVSALSKTREVNPGDLIMSNSMSFGRPYILKIKSCIHDGWIAVTEIDEKTNRDYLYYLILSPESQAYFSNNAAGSGVQNLNAEIIKLLPILIPKDPKEQQKIADCLSSTDDLIIEQAKKTVSLKAHKKGLMQQLFPAVDEVRS